MIPSAKARGDFPAPSACSSGGVRVSPSSALPGIAPDNNRPGLSPRRFPPPAPDVGQVSVRHHIDDYEIDGPDSQRTHSADQVRHSRHYRLSIEGPFGRGWHEFCRLNDGYFAIVSEIKYHMPQAGYMSSPDTAHIYLANGGDGEYVPAGGEPLSFEAPAALIMLEPAGAAAAEVCFAGDTQYIYIAIQRDALQAIFTGCAHELPLVLQSFLKGDLRHTVGRAVRLDGSLLRCLGEVHDCAATGGRRRLFLQAKVSEIVCRMVDALECREALHLAEATPTTVRGVFKAQNLLAEKFAAPPTLEELAETVGLSRSSLCNGFRQVLGTSVFDYIHELRMQKALLLLGDRDASITQIAYAVGYNRASSFSVAVQRRFGTTPSELRRKAIASAG